MKDISSITVLLYRAGEECYPMVQTILAYPFPEKICYTDEADLTEKTSALKARGVPSKEVIILKEFKGRFFQVCPKTPHMVCCNYRLINTGFNCLYDCTYCYLQSYLNSYGIMLFSNMHQVLDELENFFNSMDASLVYRIGTGEYTDSLMIDEITGIGAMLIEKAASWPNIMLELKTKSSHVDHLLDIPNKGNAVIGFSVNSYANAEKHEKGAASVRERIEAAGRAADAGFFTAFHFDPIVYTPGFENDYREIIDLIFSTVRNDSIAWISLGGFRYSPSFKEIVEANHPNSRIASGELFPGKDGKYRYFTPHRREIYEKMKRSILRDSFIGYLYLCMESASMWDDLFAAPFTVCEDLENDFSLAMKDRFLSFNRNRL